MSDEAPDEGVGTLLGTGMEESSDPLVDAIRTIALIRDAIRREDAEAVRTTLDLYAHGAGKRGLLSTLAGTESVETAVGRLAPFWQNAEYTTEAARVISPEEAEVYEVVSHPGARQPLRTVTLLRRRGGHWRVVTTSDSPDEKLVASLLCTHEPLLLDDAIPDARLDYDSEGTLVRLVQEEREWFAALRVGPVAGHAEVENKMLREALAGTATIVSMALLPSRDAAERRDQLVWFANGAAGLSEAIAAHHVYLPWCDRLAKPEDMKLDPPCTNAALAERYVHVTSDPEWTATRGLSHFMLPEVEARTMDWPSRAAAEAVVTRAVHTLLDESSSIEFEPRSTVQLGSIWCWVDYGRRGPVPGTTYGRYGSFRLAAAR